MAINVKYSFQNFCGQSFKDHPVKDFNNSEIKGTCFYQEAKENDVEVLKDIFPDAMIGVVFERCNLDNVLIPNGNTVGMRSSNQRIKIQADLTDWKLDNTLKPIEPIDKKTRLREGISIDPKDIPVEYLREEEILKTDWDKTYGIGIIPVESWFKESPQIISTKDREVKTDQDVSKLVTNYVIRGKGKLTR